MLCIHYTIQFSRNKTKALVDLENKINTINAAFTQALDITPKTTNVRAQKIDRFLLRIFKMVSVKFSLQDTSRKM